MFVDMRGDKITYRKRVSWMVFGNQYGISFR